MTIASLVYVFVHEGGKRSPSLLSLLHRKSGMRFEDTALAIEKANLIDMVTPLVFIRTSPTAVELLPMKDDFLANLSPIAFSTWWEKPIFRDDKRRLFSRKNLIHFFRHTLGGGHVGRHYESQDALDSEAFEALRGAFARSFSVDINGIKLAPQYGPEYPSVRQIGWELEQTLAKSCNDLISIGNATAPNMQPIE